MYDTPERVVSRLLGGIVASVDIPPELYAAAEREYRSLGAFLANHDSPSSSVWDVYPQGSFLLGTVVRPYGSEEFDVDLVCLMDAVRSDASGRGLLHELGDALRDYLKACQARQGGPIRREDQGRCWRLAYVQAFHMDALPAIPNHLLSPTAISLADKDSGLWQDSDPLAYAAWFKKKMEQELLAKKAALAASAKRVDPIPDWEVKTVLQRLVQVLKLHSRKYFHAYPEDRPASIIITTLAASSYKGEEELATAVIEAAASMASLVQHSEGEWQVLNPTATEENFADSWASNPQRAKAFFAWVSQLQADVNRSLEARGIEKAATLLGSAFGERSVETALKGVGGDYLSARKSDSLNLRPDTGTLVDTPGIRVKSDHTFYGTT